MRLSPSRDKAVLRRAVLAHRASAPPPDDLSRTYAEALAPLLVGVTRLAAYSSFGTEPPTEGLLRAADPEVLLPVLLPEGDLDWAAADGRPQGVGAIATCGLVVVPALAVDRTGTRLGRGGGSYDRALARVPEHVLTVALLHDGELVDALPSEPHDVRVRAVVTPSGGLRRL